ncbi:MAG: 5-oxoprolinase subunit PxpB, partial [Candidatus Eremiobacteraeota bacterium]|nr:5-oxoprolinase subunit PxpB [Candidatus Eremiobacteraeota bacterium]
MDAVSVAPCGDSAVIAVLGERIDEPTLERVWQVSALARERFGAKALDIVPAYASVLVRFDPRELDLAIALATLHGAVEDGGRSIELRPRRITVGVLFGGERGVDLEETARIVRLSSDEYIRALCAVRFRVAFLGFLAGFPYLLGLPQALSVPRLASPRDRVPPGSVAIAGGQCGIYPRSSPGGWRLLGTTHAPLFDAAREAPALFAPGDEVRFR